MRNLIEVFGASNLHRWSSDSLSAVEIPESSKNFLHHIGLPKQGDWTLRFGTPQDLPLLRSHPGMRVIGYDDLVPICLDENCNGRVIAADSDLDVRFVNSSVERFGMCLAVYQAYRVAVRHLDEEEAENVVEETVREIEDIDAAATSNEEHWWSIIIEQMRQGML